MPRDDEFEVLEVDDRRKRRRPRPRPPREELEVLEVEEDVELEVESPAVPRGFGRALGLMAAFAGGLVMALGWGYTVNHVPAPLIGLPIFVLGLWFLLFPNSSLVRRTFENARRR